MKSDIISISRAAAFACGALFVSCLHAATATVNPGDSIQVALDAVGNAGGGTVYVNSGNYGVYTQCMVPNNTTMKGSGTTRPVLTLLGSKNQQVVRNKSVPSTNVKIDYISANGGLTNAQMDAGTYNDTNGICISDFHGGVSSTNGTIINCYATSCSMGYIMGRVDNARLEACTVTNCGGAPIGSTPGLHNIYISNCDPFIARYVTSTYCRTGMGLKLTDFYGDRTETSQIVEYCQLNNNFDRGTAIYDLNPLIVRNNTCNNNGKSGINVFRCTSGGQLLNNTATGNLYSVNVAYDIWLNGCANMSISGNTYGTKNGF
jgi:parallel beta-helix repeat protein